MYTQEIGLIYVIISVLAYCVYWSVFFWLACALGVRGVDGMVFDSMCLDLLC